MITPAYSPTATERVLPRLALDFTTASLDPRVTVTRALNTATVINSSGLVATVNANLPRFDYDPSTLTCRGLLIEESRTNLYVYSEDFGNGNWSKFNSTVTTDATTAPDGAATADALVENSATGSHGLQQFYTGFTSGTSYTISLFVKAGIRSWVQFVFPSAAFGVGTGGYFNLTGAGSLGTTNGSPTSRTITAFPNGWYRITVTATATATTGGNMPISAASADNTTSYAGSNGSTALFLWGAQLEAGAFATSYIPNLATGTTTRNADVVQMTGTNFSSWYNASEGAFLTKFSFPAIPASQFRYVLAANDGTATNFIAIAGNTTSNVPAGRVVTSSVTQASMGGGAITANQQAIGVLAYKQDSFAYSQNGATTGTDTAGTVPTVNRLDIGALTTSYANCHIQRISYWPQRITNSETLAFSK